MQSLGVRSAARALRQEFGSSGVGDAPRGLRRRAAAVTAHLLALALAAAAGAQVAAAPYLDPSGAPLPFESDDEVLEFLRVAEFVEWREMEGGTNPRKREVLLDRDGLRARAVFRYGDKVDRQAPGGGFVDSYRSELAAYELSRLLGIGRVPPVVARRYRGRRGALQIWIEQGMTDADRRRRGVEPPDPEAFDRQLQIMHLFDNLIQNVDRNPGNILIDRHWQVWFIDQTRSFAGRRELKYPERLGGCDRELWRRLRSVPEAVIRDRLRKLVTYPDALMQRRRRLVEELERRMKVEGRDAVLFRLAGQSAPDPG